MIEFRLLGALSLSTGDGREVRALLTQPRRLALLAYLAVATPRGLQRRDTLAALFWPELDQQHARAALREALRVIRSALGSSALTSRGDEEVGLDSGYFWSDVAAFDQAVEAAKWDEALELYRGGLLEAFFISDAPEFERWLETERAKLEEAAAHSAMALIERSDAAGDVAGAAGWARRASRLAPFDEALLRRLISLLDRLGDRARAVQAYDEFAARLAEDFDARPAAETQALIAKVRARESAREVATPSVPANERRVPPPDRRRRVRLAAPIALLAVVILALANPGNWEGRARPERAAEDRGPTARPTSSPEAYDLYLRGRVEARSVTAAGLGRAITLLERAVALDQGFAAAYAELAHARAQRVFAVNPTDTADWKEALVASEKALRAGPHLAEAHYARAYVLWSPAYRFPHVQAVQEYRRSLELNPRLEDAHYQLGLIYLHIGFFDNAIDEFQNCLALDPTDRVAEQRIGVVLVHQRKYQEALRVFRQTPSDLNPALWNYHVAWALMHVHQDSEASLLIGEYLRQHPKDPGGLLTSARAFLHAKERDPRGAEADIRRAEQIGTGYIHFHHSASRIASAYASLGRPDSTVKWLRRAADDGMPCYPCFARDPDLDPVRNDPGFVAFMQELKAQWEQYRAELR